MGGVLGRLSWTLTGWPSFDSRLLRSSCLLSGCDDGGDNRLSDDRGRVIIADGLSRLLLCFQIETTGIPRRGRRHRRTGFWAAAVLYRSFDPVCWYCSVPTSRRSSRCSSQISGSIRDGLAQPSRVAFSCLSNPPFCVHHASILPFGEDAIDPFNLPRPPRLDSARPWVVLQSRDGASEITIRFENAE